MTISYADYLAWLKNPSSKRCLLVVLNGYNKSTGLEETFYFSSQSFATKPTDSPASWQFEPRLFGSPSMTRSIPFFGEKGDYKIGDIELVHNDGRFDDWITNYSFAGRTIIKYLGDPMWSFSDFKAFPFFTGIIESQPEIEVERVVIKIRDKMGVLDAPIQINTLTTGEPNQPIPIAYGFVRNVTPRLIDQATHKYQWHDGAVQSLDAVYDNGVSISFTANNTTGTFTLNVQPAGTITCTGQGAKPAGTYLNTAALIINDILTRAGDPLRSLNASDIDLNSLNALPNYLIGLYISDRENKLNVLEHICASMRAAFTFNREGKFQTKIIQNPNNLPSTFEITNFHLKDKSLKLSAANVPQYQTTVAYQRNYTVQKDLQTAITETTRSWLKEEYRQAIASNANVKVVCLNAENPKPLETCLDVLNDANTEATTIQNILGGQCYYVEFELLNVLYLFENGDAINLLLNDFGFQSGRKCQILSLTEYDLENEIKVKAWFYV